MSKTKSTKKVQDLSIPCSVMLFTDDAKALAALSARTGVTKSVLVRLAVRDALKCKRFKELAS